MTTKMTRKELFTALLNLDEVKANAVWVEKLKAEIEAIDKKNLNRKPTAKQVENEAIKEKIITILEGYPEGLTITQIMKLHSFEFRSNQQCTALVRQLMTEGKVTRIENKRTAFFKLAENEEEA